MHPFGGSQVCGRCGKAVYAAEQVMGPGRKLYHKPCLTCTLCNKRLDSFTLLEHDEEPYCKSCHSKNFGTRDLRQANLHHREAPTSPSSPTSLSSFPRKSGFPLARFTASSHPGPTHSLSLIRHLTSGNGSTPPPPPLLKATRSLSPTRPTAQSIEDENVNVEMEEERDTVDTKQHLFPGVSTRVQPLSQMYTGSLSNSGAVGGLPRTVPLGPIHISKGGEYTLDPLIHNAEKSLDSTPIRFATVTLGRSNSSLTAIEKERAAGDGISPLLQTATGTRYGAVLGSAGEHASAKRFGMSTPSCPRCGRSVYFAEQVKAVGKTFHKSCLRCVECSTSLDSSRLTEKNGEPLCHRCYGKLHGPQGNGYALLGKAGG